jgi:hypothetical protein
MCRWVESTDILFQMNKMWCSAPSVTLVIHRNNQRQELPLKCIEVYTIIMLYRRWWLHFTPWNLKPFSSTNFSPRRHVLLLQTYMKNTRICKEKFSIFWMAATRCLQDCLSLTLPERTRFFYDNSKFRFSLSCHWNFSLTWPFRPHYGPGVDSASKRNEFQEYFLEGKGGRCVGLTTLPPSCADFLEIWEPQTPGNLRARPGL